MIFVTFCILNGEMANQVALAQKFLRMFSEAKNKQSRKDASVVNSGIGDDEILSEDCLEMKDVEIKGEGQKLAEKTDKKLKDGFTLKRLVRLLHIDNLLPVFGQHFLNVVFVVKEIVISYIPSMSP